VAALVSIGSFSRLTHLSVKALRHYQDVGLLEPAAVDGVTGYRRYGIDQIADAQLIRRLRALEMPVDDVRAVLQAPDEPSRNRIVLAHLDRMERRLDETQAAVVSLRSLLSEPVSPAAVEIRSCPDTRVLALREQVNHTDIQAWCSDAFGRLDAAVRQAGLEPAGPSGGLYPQEYFEHGRGVVTVFVPVDRAASVAAPMQVIDLPAATLAVALHLGPYADLDRTYGALGGSLAERRIQGAGPIREHYLVTPAETDDPRRLRTEVCWPVDPARATS
jgi:DNA-binding transcriptional MerR regulator